MARTIRRDSLTSRTLHQLGDVLLIWTALVCAYWVKRIFEIGIPTDPFTSREVVFTLAGLAVLWWVVSGFLETYAFKRRLGSEVASLMIALAVTLAFFMTLAYTTRVFVYPRWLMFLLAVIGTGMLAVSRVIKEVCRRALVRRGW